MKPSRKVRSASLLLLLSFLVLAHGTLHAQCVWTAVTFPTHEQLWEIRFVSNASHYRAMTVWVLGQNFVYRTTDEGRSWLAQDSSLGSGAALFVLTDSIAMYANWTGVPPYTRGIRRTTDGGSSWTTVDTNRVYYTKLVFVDQETGFAACGIPLNDYEFRPAVRKTTDGGTSWNTIWTGAGSYELASVSFIDKSRGWAVTYDGLAFRSTDGGTTWTFLDSLGGPDRLPFRDIQFLSDNNGWAIGGIGGVGRAARTTNGGNSWTFSSPPGSSLKEISMVDSLRGWYVVEHWFTPSMALTTDGGVNWIADPGMLQQSPIEFESISMHSLEQGWAVGAGGTVFERICGDFVPGDNRQIPSAFWLGDNYPNPFNSGTVVRYGVPDAAFVTLTVYDPLGKEVTVLVNGTRLPGTYSATWDAGRFPSGVYFLRLTAAGLSLTKRLVLVR
jgi:photosystem II stability/assembly factor-like uncharacterized protein